MKKYDEEAKKSLIRALLEQPENLTVEEMRLSRKNARTLETLGITKLSGIVEQREDDLYTDMMDINENINGIDKLQIHNKVRGLNPWPVAKTGYMGKQLKIYSGQKQKDKTDALPGTLFEKRVRILKICRDKKTHNQLLVIQN